MCTESYIRILPKPRKTPQVLEKSPQAWVQLLRQNTTRIEVGLVSRTPLSGQQVTLPRSRKNTYETNYLFFSPDADMIVQVPEGFRTAPAGTLIWFPPGIPYSLYLTTEESDGTLLRFRFKVFEEELLASPWQKEELFPGCHWYPEFISTMLAEKVMPDDFTLHQHRLLLQELAIRCFRTRKEDREEQQVFSQAQMSAINDYMVQHIAQRPAPSDLSRAAGLSPAYFTKVFVQAMGKNPRRWILEQRIRYSTHLLTESTLNVSQIARSLGYEEPRLFTRQFGEVMGKSPLAYRKHPPRR